MATEETHSRMKNKKKYHKQNLGNYHTKIIPDVLNAYILHKYMREDFYDRTPFTFRSHRFLSTCVMLYLRMHWNES